MSPPPANRTTIPCTFTEQQKAFIGLHHGPKILGQKESPIKYFLHCIPIYSILGGEGVSEWGELRGPRGVRQGARQGERLGVRQGARHGGKTESETGSKTGDETG